MLANKKLIGLAAFLAIIMSAILSYFRGPAPAFGPLTPEAVRSNIQGKEFLIVGGTKGIGAALGRKLVENGAKVTVAGRSKSEETPSGANFIKYDASLVTNSRDLVVNQLKGKKFDTVVFTVGIITRPELTRTAEGIEEDLAVSYLSRFVIGNEMVKVGALDGRKRVFVMGFPGDDLKPVDIDDLNFEQIPYKQWGAHMNTVVMNEALVYSMAKRHPDVHVYGLNPGLIQTGIRDNFHGGPSSYAGKVVEALIGLTMPTVDQYADRVLLPLMASPDIQSKSGICYSKTGAELKPANWAGTAFNQEKAWEKSLALVNKVIHDVVY